MARLHPDLARKRLIEMGPWVSGSAHGYHLFGLCSPSDWCGQDESNFAHTGGGKYGKGYEHCLFCLEDIPFHREYCPWKDYMEPSTAAEAVITEDGWFDEDGKFYREARNL